MLLFLLILTGVLVWYFAFFTQQDPEPIASCGDCHCIVEEGASCPATVPQTNFTEAEIDAWASQEASNPYKLSCNPYDSGSCETNPPQDESLLDLAEEAVCAVHFENDLASDNVTQICEGSSYRLATYPSFEDAQVAGGFVTHTGHCGVCSTMQDLAAYLKHTDLTSQGKFCAKQGALLSFENGRDCYKSLGMTDDCAAIWAHNSWNTATECFATCVIELGDVPNNGPAPECKLNDCLQCDEEKSGPLFQQFAGRTRRRSGLLSAIARPCDQLVISIIQEPCPDTSLYESNLN
jgi:hypothetical protein